MSVMLDMARDEDTKRTITVVHDQVGSPTYTVDLAAMSLALAVKRASGIVHAVNTGQASWCELASEAVGLVKPDARIQPISSGQWPQKARRPSYSVLSTAPPYGVDGHGSPPLAPRRCGTMFSACTRAKRRQNVMKLWISAGELSGDIQARNCSAPCAGRARHAG